MKLYRYNNKELISQENLGGWIEYTPTENFIDYNIEPLSMKESILEVLKKYDNIRVLFEDICYFLPVFANKITNQLSILSRDEVLTYLDQIIPLLTEFQLRLEGTRDEDMDNILGKS